MVTAAQRHVLVVTYAAYNVDAVRKALHSAAERGVEVDVVVELGVEHGGKVSISPLLALLAGAHERIRTYGWPRERRPVIGVGIQLQM
jgi:hypothetical protein